MIIKKNKVLYRSDITLNKNIFSDNKKTIYEKNNKDSNRANKRYKGNERNKMRYNFYENSAKRPIRRLDKTLQ